MSRSSTSSSDPLTTGATANGAIHVPVGDAARVPMGLRAFAVGLFVAVIVGSALADTFWPAPLPKPIGLERVADEARRGAATWSDGTRMSLIEDDLKLASRVRALVRSKYALMLFDVFGEASSPAVIAGDDGWLFLTVRTGMNAFGPPEILLEHSAVMFAAMHRRLANLGIRSISVPLPRKCVVEREHLPGWVKPVEELDFGLVDAWRARGIETVDLLPLFESPPAEPIYERAGSHWTRESNPVVAEEIARQCGLWVAPELRNSRLVEVGVAEPATDMLTSLGIDEEDARALAGRGVHPLSMVVPRRRAKVTCANQLPMPALAIGGTSFTPIHAVPCFLRHFTNQPLWTLSRGGGDGITPLSEFLTEQPDWPQTLLLETPEHLLLAIGYTYSVGLLLGDHPPRTPLTRLPRPASLAETLAKGKWTANSSLSGVGEITAGLLGTTGDGVAELQLVGEVRGSDLEILISTPDVQMRFPWRVGQPQVVLPVIGRAPSPYRVHVACRSLGESSELTLTDVQLVVAGAQHPAEFVVGELQHVDGRSVLPMSAASSGPLPRHSLMWIQLRGTAPLTDVQLEVVATDRPPFVWSASALAPDASIVVNIGALQGASLESAKLSARGPVAVESVVVLAP